eukprot:scaffold4795_cov126-Isochrysis_galbana.AAC.6
MAEWSRPTTGGGGVVRRGRRQHGTRLQTVVGGQKKKVRLAAHGGVQRPWCRFPGGRASTRAPRATRGGSCSFVLG